MQYVRVPHARALVQLCVLTMLLSLDLMPILSLQELGCNLTGPPLNDETIKRLEEFEAMIKMYNKHVNLLRSTGCYDQVSWL